MVGAAVNPRDGLPRTATMCYKPLLTELLALRERPGQLNNRDTTIFAAVVIPLSLLLYAVELSMFHEPRQVLTTAMGDLAFLPLSVLGFTLLVDRLLAARERQSRQHKMNMVIGTFFSDAGRALLKLMAPLLLDPDAVCQHARVDPTWTADDLARAVKAVRGADLHISPSPECLAPVRDVLFERRAFMLTLLENPVLLDHESFSDLLWAVFHLQEELSARATLADLPEADRRHLAADAERAFSHLLSQWLEYMIYLRADYPYLFSFAARTNPLRADATPEVV
jgi:hypothetical protein